MPVQLTAIGNVGGYTVSVEAQVAGELLDVHFQEGGFVHKGQLLFTIDPRPYEAALAQAQAQLSRDKAVAANGRAQAQRISKLLTDGVVSPSDADSSTSAAAAAEATVAADEAALKTAQLNLQYCNIYSPMDGRTGAVLVKPGNLVKVADVPIVVIKRLSPIPVDFLVPARVLARDHETLGREAAARRSDRAQQFGSARSRKARFCRQRRGHDDGNDSLAGIVRELK